MSQTANCQETKQINFVIFPFVRPIFYGYDNYERQEEDVVSKAKIDVLIMLVAMAVGGFYSMTNNPLTGAALLILILTAWNLGPKVPAMIKAKARVKK